MPSLSEIDSYLQFARRLFIFIIYAAVCNILNFSLYELLFCAFLFNHCNQLSLKLAEYNESHYFLVLKYYMKYNIYFLN